MVLPQADEQKLDLAKSYVRFNERFRGKTISLQFDVFTLIFLVSSAQYRLNELAEADRDSIGFRVATIVELLAQSDEELGQFLKQGNDRDNYLKMEDAEPIFKELWESGYMNDLVDTNAPAPLP